MIQVQLWRKAVFEDLILGEVEFAVDSLEADFRSDAWFKVPLQISFDNAKLSYFVIVS
jgi:hypothetical protein